MNMNTSESRDVSGENKLKRAANWTAEEEMLLVEEVSNKENILFGKLKGDGSVKVGEVKTRGWQDIADVLNARFLTKKRDIPEIKKKYYNIRQRSKEKLDQAKRPKTGGGPAHAYSQAETVFLSLNEERPNISGLTCGIDTEFPGMEQCTFPADENVHETVVLNDDVTVETECEQMIDDNVQPGKKPDMNSGLNASKGSKGQRRKLAELEMENLKLDNIRLKEEIHKIREEREAITMKKEIMALKKAKLISEMSGHLPLISLLNEN